MLILVALQATMHRTAQFCLCVLALHLTSSYATGQISSSQQDASSETILSTSALVVVPTSVRSATGEPVTKLDASHFRITDNGIEQKLSVGPAEEQPLALVVLVQTDSAATDHLANYRKLDTMLETKLTSSERKIALMTFGARVDQIWAFPPAADAVYYVLTHPGYLLLNREDDDSTGAAIIEAVNSAIGLLQQQPADFRRVILLLSQLHDGGSKIRFEDVERHLAESGTTLYSLTFSPKETESSHVSVKSANTAIDLAAQSGGEGIQFDDENDLERGLSLVSDDINKSYTLSFYPTSHDAGRHIIEVQIINQPSRLKVVPRRSYWFARATEKNR